MGTKLYTTIFNHMEGTYVTQVRVDSIDQVLEAWLLALRTETTDLIGKAGPISILDFFDSHIEGRKRFEQQVRETLARGERLTALAEVNVWCACFLITLLGVEHDSACPTSTSVGLSDPATFVEAEVGACPACLEGASHMCELYVVETAGS